MRTIGIVFGGSSTEHNESIRAARILYRDAIRKLESRYRFRYYLLTRDNKFVSNEESEAIIKKTLSKRHVPESIGYDRIYSLARVDVIYSTLMGTCGENGNIMGLADILKVPIIGCDILASALTLDKKLSKIVAKSASVPVVDYLCVNKDISVDTLIDTIENTVKFPCFVKPTNLGTCAHVFRANNPSEFSNKWRKTTHKNNYSNTYLIEKFIPNVEVRVFIYEDSRGELHSNDEYVTVLKESAIGNGGVLFDHLDNELPDNIRKRINRYAIKIFKLFGMKDYARIDFFVEKHTNKIYFNEANTQPFIGSSAIEFMERDGLKYYQFFDLMIRKNLH